VRCCISILTWLNCANDFEDEEKPLPCVIQDPDCSALETEYLNSLGLEVVLDPDIFAKIETESLVYFRGTYLSLAWWTSDGTWPRAMVTEDWSNRDIVKSKHDPSRKLFQYPIHVSHDSFF
jgi:hypothetical protein